MLGSALAPARRSSNHGQALAMLSKSNYLTVEEQIDLSE
jgi:hypothetical protein